MVFDPNATDIMPTETIKLGHHAHEGREELEAREIAHRERVNPFTFAASHLAGAAWTGAISLAGFGLTYALISGMMAATPLALLAIPLTGALWYGGNAFIKAYGAAKEHNESLGDHFRDQLRGLGRQRDRSAQPAIVIGDGGDAGVTIFGAQASDERQRPQDLETNERQRPQQIEPQEQERQRPAFLEKIIAQGSRAQLTPKELAAQIEAERAARAHQSV